MATTTLGAKAVGSVVKLKENGVLVDYLVVHQGRPSTIYDVSCDGTWLLRLTVAENRQWHNTNLSRYGKSDIYGYLNNTFINRFDADIRIAIKQVKIPYVTAMGNGGAVGNGTNGLSSKIFLLAGCEVGWTDSTSSYFPEDGTCLSYFTRTADAKRVARLNGSVVNWWLRSPKINTSRESWHVNTNGSYNYAECIVGQGVRPAVIMPTDLKVLDDGTVTTNQFPATPGGLTLPAIIRSGLSFTITWPASTDPDGNLAGYKLERSYNGNGVWTQVYQGAATNATDMLPYGVADTVQYRVKAYDAEGAESGWYTSATKTVVNNQAPTAPPSITVPLAVTGGESLLVSWVASTDQEGNLSGYILERQTDGGAWELVYTGPSLSYQDTTTKGWTTVAYRVKAVDALGDESTATTSPTRAVDNNSPPEITCIESGDLGEKAAGFTIAYSVSDQDGDTVTVTEQVDGEQLRSFQAQAGVENTFQVEGEKFMTLLNGEHTLTISARDSRAAETTERTVE